MRRFFAFFVIFIAMTLSACGGGIGGTGGGPIIVPGSDGQSGGTYQLRNLPGRISPDIPKTLLRGEELTPSQSGEPEATENEHHFLPRADNNEVVESIVWRRFSARLVDTSLTRANAQMNSTILDVAFDEIVNQCADQLSDCTIPAERIRVQLTQGVINRLKEIVIDLIEGLPREYLGGNVLVDWEDEVNEQFASLVDSEVVFGETHYSKLDGAPYDHSVRTLLQRKSVSNETFSLLLWSDEEFHARWHEDGHVAKFLLNNDDLSIREYFYQNDAPSELIVARIADRITDGPWYFESDVKVVANNPANAGVLVEIASPTLRPAMAAETTDAGEMSFDYLTHEQFQVQMDNDGGYATHELIGLDVTDIPRAIFYSGSRESFDFVGKLIAGTQCTVNDFDQGIEVCEQDEFRPVNVGQAGALIADSPYFFQAEDFDSMVAVHDAIQWRIQGLPAEVKTAAVVLADSATELSERELLCRGYRVFGDDTRTFCSATDEQLDNVDVLELIDGMPAALIPSARLVPF